MLRLVHDRLRRSARPPAPRGSATRVPDAGSPHHEPEQDYARWVEQFDTLDEARLQSLRVRIDALERRPLVSVVVTGPAPERGELDAVLTSMQAQLYPEWELCAAVPGDPAVRWGAPPDDAGGDARLRLVHSGELAGVAAVNGAIAAARGEWLLLLDEGDELAPHAIAVAMLEIVDRPSARFVYSDEDVIDDVGRRSAPLFKPDFDPLLLLGCDCVRHLCMIRRHVVDAAGPLRPEAGTAAQWDLVLRVADHLERDQVVHLPHVLCHRRTPACSAPGPGGDPGGVTAADGAAVVAAALERRGRRARVTANPVTGIVRARWPLPDPAPLVSVVVPTRDGRHLRRCLESLLVQTSYPAFEVVVVDNGSVEESTRRTLDDLSTWLTVVRDDRPFNYSALNNDAVSHCRGEVLCFLNDDCEVVQHGWLEEMVGQLAQDGVAAVGAELLYPDGRVQHAGVVLGIGGEAGHVHRLADRLDRGYGGWLQAPRSLSAVTAACMVVRRDVFEKLGGFDAEHLAVSYSDVDFCLRANAADWRVVWTPFAVLVHHESASRGPDAVVRPKAAAREAAYLHERWGDALCTDPAYNPNLSLQDTDFSLAFPPRVRTPWDNGDVASGDAGPLP